MNNFRIEKDIIGDKEVPINAYYGVQTLRGKENFTISYQTLHKAMIDGLAIVKKACAITNYYAGLLEGDKKMKDATKLYEQAAACTPADAMERLDVELAKAELED